MAYEKQNFKDGEILRASQLNLIEDGIIENIPAVASKTAAGLVKPDENFGVGADGTLSLKNPIKVVDSLPEVPEAETIYFIKAEA